MFVSLAVTLDLPSRHRKRRDDAVFQSAGFHLAHQCLCTNRGTRNADQVCAPLPRRGETVALNLPHPAGILYTILGIQAAR
jgi:hypothetical protein